MRPGGTERPSGSPLDAQGKPLEGPRTPWEALGMPVGSSKGLQEGLEGPEGAPRRAEEAPLRGLELPRGGLVGSKVGAGARLILITYLTENIF